LANVVKLKNSGVQSSVPVSLEHGEIAINYADKKLFYKDSNNSILSFDLSTNLNIDAGFAQADIYEAEVTNVITVFYDGGQI
jgi:hypothetical protein